MGKAQRSLLVALVGAAASAGLAQDFEIFLVAPEQVFGPSGTTYEVEVWGSVSGWPWVDGTSAMAEFGIDIIATGGRSLVFDVSTGQGGPEIILSDAGLVVGPDLWNVRGGQLANLFGFLHPAIDLSNPMLLFTFEVEITGGVGRVEYAPMNPVAEGGLSFYPDSTDGASITAPNDPGTTLTLTGAGTWINTPAAGTATAMMVAGSLMRIRRRR